MHVIGTAGHVDHGKSTLIEALSGIHPDRLKEEREREMTIDLGFAWMVLPADEYGHTEEIGIVDVPGHRDFIENMLAGIGGIDAALFVVAADEGMMPQSREHLAILDILQIQAGVVALTKIDLINDPDWLELIESDVNQTLVGTVLEGSPIVKVSARTGEGINELKIQIRNLLAERPVRQDLNRPRLPIDRVFTMAGFGSVITGTLLDGQLHVGDEVEILPKRLKGRIRGLQTHKHKETVAVPGSRTAVNISGISLEDLQRGDVVTHPGNYRPTSRLDVRFRLLPDVSLSLRHNTEVKVFIGTAEVIGRLRLLGTEELHPGQQGWLQLELQQPVVATRGDHYIVRRPSPGETLGGGQVVDPHPKGLHKRFSAETLRNLETLSAGNPAEVLLQALISLGSAQLKDVLARSNLEKTISIDAVRELFDSGLILNLDAESRLIVPSAEDFVINRGLWTQIAQRTIQEISDYHRNYPMRRGIPREELKSRTKDLTQNSQRLFTASLKKLIVDNAVIEIGPLVALPEHQVTYSRQQQKDIDRLLERFAREPYSPPSYKECEQEIGEEVAASILEQGLIIQVAPDVVFSKPVYEQMVADIQTYIQKKGSITVAQARDHFNTSRKYMLAILEHLDQKGITIRNGDERRLRK